MDSFYFKQFLILQLSCYLVIDISKLTGVDSVFVDSVIFLRVLIIYFSELKHDIFVDLSGLTRPSVKRKRAFRPFDLWKLLDV